VFRYAAVLLLLSWPAIAEVHLDYTFSQWEKLQDADRTAYIARFIDTLRTIAATEPAQLAARHHSQCIIQLGSLRTFFESTSERAQKCKAAPFNMR